MMASFTWKTGRPAGAVVGRYLMKAGAQTEQMKCSNKSFEAGDSTGEVHAEVLHGFQTMMDCGPATEPRLRGVIGHVLASPGSLLRARLIFSIMTSNGAPRERALALAIAVEYFHTASLIFDDMPMMDDALERRGSPCSHVQFGEAAAALGALAFINRGYSLLWEVIGNLPAEDRIEASQLVANCLGTQGILNGQSRDLNFRESARTERDVLEVANGKTVTLIRLTLLLPAIACAVDRATRIDLDELSSLWGRSYQIMDDFKDHLMSPHETGKTAARDDLLERPNMLSAIGRDTAWRRVTGLMAGSNSLVQSLVDRSERWHVLKLVQHALDRDQSSIENRLCVASAA